MNKTHLLASLGFKKTNSCSVFININLISRETLKKIQVKRSEKKNLVMKRVIWTNWKHKYLQKKIRKNTWRGSTNRWISSIMTYRGAETKLISANTRKTFLLCKQKVSPLLLQSGGLARKSSRNQTMTTWEICKAKITKTMKTVIQSLLMASRFLGSICLRQSVTKSV